MMRRVVVSSLALACGAAAWARLDAAAGAADWPQWRGPGRDGRVAGLAPRTSWPETLVPGWKLAVGAGHSSPIVAGDRVYQFSREGEEEVLRAIELASGRVQWRQAYRAPYEMNPAATGHGKGPKATPALADGRIFTLGISGVLSAWEAASGRLLWRKTFEGSHRATAPEFGAAASPLVDSGRVIASVGGDRDGELAAFDAATGAAVWSWKGDGPGYASPVVASWGGVRQVVTQSQSAVVSVAADSGTLLFKLPLTTPYEQNSVTPIVSGELLIYTGLDAPLTAVRPTKAGAGWSAPVAWTSADVASYLSTPVLVDGRLYGLSHRKRGQYFCVDAASGKTLWLSEARQAENAAILAGAGVLFVLETDGALKLLAAGAPGAAAAPAFRVLREWKVADSATWAHPVVTGDAVLVKDVDSLALLRMK